MSSDELFAKARSLDALADEIEVVFDSASTVASSPNWHCDNATDVRGQISTYRKSAVSAAGTIREKAGTVRSQARAALAEERADEKDNVPR